MVHQAQVFCSRETEGGSFGGRDRDSSSSFEVKTETKVVRLYSVAVVTVLPRLVKTEKVVVHLMDVIGTVPHLLAMIENFHLLTVMK